MATAVKTDYVTYLNAAQVREVRGGTARGRRFGTLREAAAATFEGSRESATLRATEKKGSEVAPVLPCYLRPYESNIHTNLRVKNP